MLISKCLLTFFLLSVIDKSLGKPSENNTTEGRGFASTLWEWITYPFMWWSYGSNESPVTEPQIVFTTTLGPYDNIEIAKRNITIWCNDQTCTTMKCNNTGCKNLTCNIYDTDVTGECREYNVLLKPETPLPSDSTQRATLPTTKSLLTTIPVTKLPDISTPVLLTTITSEKVQEHPLELEAVLSSTVGSISGDKALQSSKVNSSSPQNKV